MSAGDQVNETQSGDDAARAGEPARDGEPARRMEAREADDGMPEEAGYGYGV